MFEKMVKICKVFSLWLSVSVFNVMMRDVNDTSDMPFTNGYDIGMLVMGDRV